ncbi:Tryptophan decarboxylase [Sporomusa rhizae]|uniref:pyridoxal phosphate-dependent decarboxylase family protein n=1 Tax=Sporomusa rhizae TaxID=357999 RepID=UPI00352B8897
MALKTVSDHFRQHAEDWTLFEQAKDYALDYMRTVLDRPVFPEKNAIEGLEAFRSKLPEDPVDPHEILTKLNRFGSPATVAQTGGRYFGFVNGGVIPAALAAKWLGDAWDQNAALYVISPVMSVLEEICEEWLVDLLGLPENTAAGFVGGSSTATLCGLAAGRDYLLRRQGWDVNGQGLFGAPPIRVVLGEGAHSTVYKALSILGLGKDRLIKVPEDDQGRIRADSLPELDDKTLLILQAGNVNSGAFDPFAEICGNARAAGAWTHIDGAFGLWAAASPKLQSLTDGYSQADSWSVDAHKTLNAPYDNGIILCRHREALAQALHMTGSYIVYSQNRDGMLYTPDMSRRGRAVELWASLMALGRSGTAELVEDLHQKAQYLAMSLEKEGFQIRNEVCFNQVLVSCDNSDITNKVLDNIQQSGECWCGPAQWKGEKIIRISVCSYRTTKTDLDRTVTAFVKARQES